MIVIEEAKRFMCHKCGSVLGVIASDIKEGGQGSLEKTDDGQSKARKYFSCPVCQHNNFLAKEDAPTINAKLVSDAKAYTQPDYGFEKD